MATQVLYILFGGMALGAALLAVTRKNPVASAIWLVVMFFGLAATYVVMEAFFVGAIQILVYAGAIMVLFLFVIMLLGVDKVENLQVEPFRLQRPVAVVVGAAVLSFLGIAIIVAKDAPIVDVAQSTAVSDAVRGGAHDSNIRALARDLFSDHVLAFELTSVLLVIAVVGTVVLARKPRKGELA